MFKNIKLDTRGERSLFAAIALSAALMLGVLSIFLDFRMYEGGVGAILLAFFLFVGPLYITAIVVVLIGGLVYLVYYFLFKNLTKKIFIASVVILFPVFVYGGFFLNLKSWDVVWTVLFGKEYVYERDTNADGKVDKWIYKNTRTSATTRIVKDTNFDGKQDVWEYKDPDEKIIKIETDIDFDGKIDKVEQFNNENKSL